jgi:hypothetical protein
MKSLALKLLYALVISGLIFGSYIIVNSAIAARDRLAVPLFDEKFPLLGGLVAIDFLPVVAVIYVMLGCMAVILHRNVPFVTNNRFFQLLPFLVTILAFVLARKFSALFPGTAYGGFVHYLPDFVCAGICLCSSILIYADLRVDEQGVAKSTL